MIRALILALAVLATPALADRLTMAPLVDTAWLLAHLHDPGLLIVDVRDPDTPATTFDNGHIDGAVSAPFATFGWQAPADGLPPAQRLAPTLGRLGIGDGTQVVLIPDGLSDFEFAKAARAYWVLKSLGHDAVTILDGGQVAWVAAGLATVSGGTTPQPTTFTARPNAALALTTAQVVARLPRVTLIDARSPAEFNGQRKVGLVARAGTIPGAFNLPHGTLYDGTFAKPAQILALLAAAHIPTDRPIVTFCNVGYWSALDWFALSEVAGLPDVALYPGSMAAWAADPSRIVQ